MTGESTDSTGNESSDTESARDMPPGLIEQYTTYVNTTLDVSNRRMKNNRFYVLLLSGTLAVVSVLANTDIIQAAGLLLAGLLGLGLCILWYLSIVSYKQLNSGKYEVIGEMEERHDLPMMPFSREWKVLEQGQNPRTYITHTRVERKIPGLLAIPYLLITLYALSGLF